MFANQKSSSIYPMPRRGNPVARPTPLDINWFNTWPTIRSIFLGSLMLLSSAAIIGLDIANLAIESNKQPGTPRLGVGPAKVGAGIWSGSISFLAALFILVIIFVQNKRLAATFAFIAVTLALAFTVVLVGLTANSVQVEQYPYSTQNLQRTQYELIIAILSIALFLIILCITFFIMYISVFFSSSTRRSTKY